MLIVLTKTLWTWPRWVVRLTPLALLCLGASGQALQTSAQGAAPEAQLPRLPLVYVLNGEGAVAAAFGPPGSEGRVGRSDLEEVPDDVRCTQAHENPLQAALDWAAAKGHRRVCLDAGEYTFEKPLDSYIGPVGFHVSSGLHLKGVVRDGVPTSVLTAGPALNPAAGVLIPDQKLNVLLLPSGDRKDPSQPLTNTTIQAVFLRCRMLAGVGMWAGGGSGFKLDRVHVAGSRQSALIVGTWDAGREDPEVKYRAAIYYQRDFDIGWCHVHDSGADGLCVIGRRGVVHDNLCENGNSHFDNGITAFIGSTDIQFLRNRILNFPVGIGLDGGYMPVRKLDGCKDAKEAEALSTAKLWELYHGAEGYHHRHEIAQNEIRGCWRGIVFHRAADCRVHDNIVIGRGLGEGISLEEANDNLVWQNRITGFEIACRLYSHKYSATGSDGRPIGTSFNKIGLDPLGAVAGNDFCNNERGIVLVRGIPDARIRRNEFHLNNLAGCTVPYDFVGGDEGEDRQIASRNRPDLPEEVHSKLLTPNR